MNDLTDIAPALGAVPPDDDLMFDIEDGLFDFDFSSVDVRQIVHSATASAHKSLGREIDQNTSKVVFKPTKGGVTKPKRKPNKRTSRMLQGMVDGSKVPNMSRRAEGSVLVAFPTFDKCDSLVFLPNSFARFMNNGDMAGMTELIKSHTTKNCEYTFKGHNVKLAGFLGLNEIGMELHPDAVSCVSVTKVVNNSIQAKVFSKFTECDPIFDSVAVMRRNDPTFRLLFGDDTRKSKRIDRWTKKVQAMNKDEDERAEIIKTVVRSPGNMLVYGSYYMTFTFDDMTRKVNKVEYDFEVTSLTNSPESIINIGCI